MPEKEEESNTCILGIGKNESGGVHTASAGSCNFTPKALKRLEKIDPLIAKQAQLAQLAEQVRNDPTIEEHVKAGGIIEVDPKTGNLKSIPFDLKDLLKKEEQLDV